MRTKEQPKTEKLLSPAAAAERLGVSRSSVYTLVKLGQLPSPRPMLGLRRVGFPESAVDAYLARCAAEAPPEVAAA